jgi:hypothetical protein
MYAVLWSIGVASDSPSGSRARAATVDRRLAERKVGSLEVINGRTFEAMRVAYPYIEKLLTKPGRIITDRRRTFPDHFVI